MIFFMYKYYLQNIILKFKRKIYLRKCVIYKQ